MFEYWKIKSCHSETIFAPEREVTRESPSIGPGTISVAPSFAAPTDPKFGNQWHLDNPSGIDINVFSDDANDFDVWDDYTGAGVVVGIIDSGVQHSHTDLNDNYNFSLDFDALGNDNDATPDILSGSSQAHGTSVAGVIAAELNGQDVVGVAFGAEVTGFRMGFGSQGSVAQTNALLARQDDADVSNSSWGYGGYFSDDFDDPFSFGFGNSGALIEEAVDTGRDGLGTVFVFAAGNERLEGQDANYHAFQNSPYTIAVAATGSTGNLAYFSSPGAPVLVSAGGVAIRTTDLSGTGNGYNTAADGTTVALNGTSFSAPTVSGVVALMLEANPNLGYRDVQEIIAYSAVLTDSNDLIPTALNIALCDPTL